jgi:[ribosomal protein S5]-alanine N-acetyltransferase
VGILIGDPAFRGRGVTSEVLAAAGNWLRSRYDIRHIALGVSRDNRAAVRAYEKVGFVVSESPYIPDPPSSSITMVWEP